MQNIEADIVIVGGGVAGFAAAIAAASENKKVVLLDKNHLLGGDSVNTNVGTICGAFIRSASSPQLVGYNFSERFFASLKNICAFAKPVSYHKGLYIIPYEWEDLQNLYADMLNQYKVEVRNNTEVDSIHIEGRSISHLTATHSKINVRINCQAVIDCSGNAIVSQLSGIETIKEDSYQAASQVFRVAGAQSVDEFALTMGIKRAVLKRTRELHWPSSYNSLSIVPGSLRNNTVDLKLTLPETITDHAAENVKTGIEAHKRVVEIFQVIKHDIPSLQNASIEKIFPQPGIRVLQRSKGKYILTEEDIMTSKKFDDGIAIGTWPIEEWKNDGQLVMSYFPMESTYSIPSGCLMSPVLDNLFFAGKNISATSRAIASARVMGTGLQTGYAAGKLSCAKNAEDRDHITASLHHELYN
jgi:glycine/D-amino acid oxidase-like deaminating enzyme